MKIRVILLWIVLSLTAVGVASAQEEEPAGVDCQHPRVLYLVEKTGATCQEIVDLHAAGVGFGQIMKAAVLSEGLPNYQGSWQELLAAHQAGTGWGEIRHAYGLAGRYAELGLSPDDLMALKDSGMGWGQIAHAQALASADLGVSFEQAASALQSGQGWGEIRQELGLPEGPPPWAGGPNKANGGQHGPPAHAQGQGQGPGQGQGNQGDDSDE